MAWFVTLLIAVAVSIVSYLIQPRPKQPKPPAASDLERPTADADRPIPKVWGTMTIKSPNFLWYGEVSKEEYEKKEGGGKK